MDTSAATGNNGTARHNGAAGSNGKADAATRPGVTESVAVQVDILVAAGHEALQAFPVSTARGGQPYGQGGS